MSKRFFVTDEARADWVYEIMRAAAGERPFDDNLRAMGEAFRIELLAGPDPRMVEAAERHIRREIKNAVGTRLN